MYAALRSHPRPDRLIDLDERDLAGELDGLGVDDAVAGRVLAQYTERWLVSVPGEPEPRLAPGRGRLRQTEVGPPVTGDWVALDADGGIVAVLARHGTLSRRAAGSSAAAQVLAANVDLVLVTESLPDPSPRRIERFVALATADGIPAALVLTKADLDPNAWEAPAPLARQVGLTDAIAVSAATGDGLAGLRALLAPGVTAVLLGPSGVGKSTLVNALAGSDRQATAPVRDHDGRGRHTTVTREMFTLPGGAHLIDTPGIREIGLWIGPGDAFADLEAAALGCRFADCRHEAEPGCAVREQISPERIDAWRKLAREQAFIEDRQGTMKAKRQFGRKITREQRSAARHRPDPDGED